MAPLVDNIALHVYSCSQSFHNKASFIFLQFLGRGSPLAVFQSPVFCFPCGFLLRACLITIVVSFRSVIPIHVHFDLWISFLMGGTKCTRFVMYIGSVCLFA